MTADERFEMFKEFLISEGIWSEYWGNIKNSESAWRESPIECVKEQCKKSLNPTDLFVMAFDWDETKEGYDFWRDINYKWSNRFK